MDIKDRKEEREMYIKIDNKHIFVQPDASIMPILDDLSEKENQIVHVFEIYPEAVRNILELICNKVARGTKVIIHVPRMVKDYAKVIEMLYLFNISGRWKVITERKGAEFSYIQDGYHKYFKVTFTKDKYNYYIHTYLESSTHALPIRQYKLGENLRAVMTAPQQRYPSIFKDRIIKNFKRATPDEILKSFKDDEDIWNFLLTETFIMMKDSKMNVNIPDIDEEDEDE